MMLIISVVVLLVLLAAIGLIYGIGGVRSPGDAPPVVGESVGDLTGPAPVDAQPVDPEGDITAYDAAPEGETPEFAPPPEEVQPRPEPREPAEAAPLPPARSPRRPIPRLPKRRRPRPAPSPRLLQPQGPPRFRSAPSRPAKWRIGNTPPWPPPSPNMRGAAPRAWSR
ncbi:hypothetical protein [Brevundimonas denitrificans]|uniref:hypothetical protein n=1 Tax=Brevundimonas denitrificans TaxID=1443434 RepID=UPI00223B70CE|nr:hypothetical protein [Brevundimonas denitrificans]